MKAEFKDGCARGTEVGHFVTAMASQLCKMQLRKCLAEIMKAKLKNRCGLNKEVRSRGVEMAQFGVAVGVIQSQDGP